MLVIKFFSKTCGPCKMMEPLVESLKEEIGFDLKSVDIGSDKSLAVEYNIRAVPSFVVVEEGKPPRARSGACNRDTLKQFIIGE